jgi:hypothetical protein
MGKKAALLIGTTRYDDARLAQLHAPDADIEALAAVLRDPDLCAFDSVEVLRDQVFAEVQLAVSRFFSEGKKDDLLLWYFSGHGIVDDAGRLYLCLKNSNRSLIRATALRAGALSDEIDLCRSERQVVILDCCHAGAFVRGAKGGTGIGETVGTMAAFEGTGRGRVVLTATDATQFAFEGDRITGETGNRSLFTHFFIEALTTGLADSDGDGQITVDEAFAYAYQRVIQAAPDQTPGKWAYKQQGDIVLAKNAHPVPLRNLIDPGLLESAAAGKPLSVREASVRALSRYLSDARPGVVLAARDILLGLAEDDSRTIAALARSALDSRGRIEGPSLPTTSLDNRPTLPSTVSAIARSSARAKPVTSGLAIIGAVGCAALFSRLFQHPPVPQQHAPAAALMVPALPTAAIAGLAASATPPAEQPAVLGPHLRVERGSDVSGVKIYVVRDDATVVPLETFPADVPVSRRATVTLEAYWGKKHLVERVQLGEDESERRIHIDSHSSWHAGGSAPPQPTSETQILPAAAPRPAASILVSGRVRSGSMENDELNAGLRQLKAGFLGCPIADVSGKATFIATVENDGRISTFVPQATALPSELTTCFYGRALGARFPGGRKALTFIDIVAKVSPAPSE